MHERFVRQAAGDVYVKRRQRVERKCHAGMIRTITATQYITPLREGSSLPAIVEADDGQLYVMKFVGAGHGAKALIAELLAGEIGRALGLRVPEIVLLLLDPALGPSEPDPEIHDLLKASVGLNLGLSYLPNAFGFNMLLQPPPDPSLASMIVWFDSFVTNIDRSPRNVNILIWQGDLWLIDHGSCLYFHHSWDDYLERSHTPFPYIKDHTLMPFASRVAEAGEAARARLTSQIIGNIADMVPDEWLGDEERFAGPTEHRLAYVAYLLSRLEASHIFVQEAMHAYSEFV